MKRFILTFLITLASISYAFAQSPMVDGYYIPSTTQQPNGATTYAWQPVTASTPLPISSNAYPIGATPITGNAAGTTGAVVGTLAAAAAKTTYICGVDVSAIGGTAAIGPITVAGLVTSSMVYQLASSATGVTLNKTYTPCIPASAVNTAITITTTADGTASAVNVNSWGYQQ